MYLDYIITERVRKTEVYDSFTHDAKIKKSLIPENLNYFFIDTDASCSRLRMGMSLTAHVGSSAQIHIQDVYANCGILILSALEGSSDKMRKLILDTAIKMSKAMGYSQLIYTIRIGQGISEDILEAGFTALPASLVKNKRSNNQIQLYFLNI